MSAPLVESAIFFLIGFLTAAFLALLAAPAISRRAARLAAARARLQSPLSAAQARAERDALRGQHAVETVRLERRLKAAETDRAAMRVEQGRQASRVVELEDLAADRAAEIMRLRSELAALQVETRDQYVQLGAQEVALRDVLFQRDASDRGFALARVRIMELETLADENRAAIAGLETRAASLEVQLSDLQWASAAAARDAESERLRLSAALAERMDAAVRLQDELAAAHAHHAERLREVEAQLADVARIRERLQDVEPRLGRSEAAREELMFESGRQLARLAERDVALARAEAAHRDLELRMAAEAEAAEANYDALATQNQALTTAHAAMEGALRAARGDRGDLQREVESLRARLTEAVSAAQAVSKGDLALRQSIARLGREIARAQGAAIEEEPAAGHIVNFARREPPLALAHSPELAPTGPLRQDQPIASER